jgi:hypothetical protein
MGIWNSIENLSVCEPLPLPAPYRRILLVRIQEDGTHWLVGPFRELTKVATDLRSVEKLCNILSHRDVRLGLREDDKPLAAEFHQRYLSAILKQTHRWDRQELQTRISATYESLYRSRSRLFLPLWEISKIILHEAGIKT